MILFFVKMNALPEKHKELCQTIHSIIAQVRQEQGCLESNFYRNADSENEILLVEAWENRKALDAHLQSIRFTVLIGARGLMRRPPKITIHSVSHSSQLVAENSKIQVSKLGLQSLE